MVCSDSIGRVSLLRVSTFGGRMARSHRKKPVPVVGDTFGVPLEGGRFAVCRVLSVDEIAGMLLVANADWIDRKLPDTRDPALRSVLQLTHHSWGGRPSAAWVSGAPPDDYIPLGNIPLDVSENAIPERGTGGWPFFRIQPYEQWLWDHPEDVLPPPPPPEGHFILHRFNGDEVYHLESAVLWAYETAQGVTLWFEVKADSENAQRCEDTAEMGMSPNAEVGIDLPDLDANELVGREFIVPGTKADDEDSCKSLLYYCEHEDLRDNRIKVVSRDGNRFLLRWTAVVRDVNHYDGSKPPTKVEIEGEFMFKDIGKWTKA
jgi:hypothetical protein